MERRHNAINEAFRRSIETPEEVQRMIRERAEHVLSQKPSDPEGK